MAATKTFFYRAKCLELNNEITCLYVREFEEKKMESFASESISCFVVRKCESQF